MSNEISGDGGPVDLLVVGGGVAGLALALRAACAGRRVMIFERDLFGSGASIGNSGIIHSPVYYLRDHPRVAGLFVEAQRLFRQDFPEAGIAERGWFYGERSSIREMRDRLEQTAMPCRHVSTGELRELAPASAVLARSEAIAVPEYVVSPRSVVSGLVERCGAAGVEMRSQTPVKEILVSDGRVRGAAVGAGQQVLAEKVVLAAGAGLRELLAPLRSGLARGLRSRAQTMVAVRNRGLLHPLQPLERSGAGAVPASDGFALVGRDDLIPDLVLGPRPIAVRYDAVQATIEAATGALPGVLDASDGVRAWVSIKTDLGAAHELGSTNPNPVVFDHETEGIRGLYTFLPGKLTLMYHASKWAAEVILRSHSRLALPAVQTSGAPVVSGDALTQLVPWA